MTRRRATSLLAPVVALSFLGTSRPLVHKVLTGTVAAAPSGVGADGPPKLLVRENVNNQGCFAPQKIDLTLSLPLRNTEPAPLIIEDQGATVELDGRKMPTRFVVRTRDGTSTGRFEWAGGAARSALPGEVARRSVASPALLSAEAVADKAALAATTIEVLLQSNRGPIRVRFADVDKTPPSESPISNWP
jgi:hypothetical protein